jgi:DNA polymerase-1
VPNVLRTLRRTTRGDGLYVPIDGAELLDLRSMIRAPRGQRFADADYSQQELRVLAHFAGGDIAKAYRENPRMDLHIFARDLLNRVLSLGFSRTQSKAVGLGIIYGMGLDELAGRVGTDRRTASAMRRTYKQHLGIDKLEKELRAAKGCLTWGGRWCPVEPEILVYGEIRSFEYKLINTLVQGSSADVTKESMIRYDAVRKDGRMLLTVHDELVIVAPTKAIRAEAKILTEAMQSVELEVPMLTDAKVGPTWRAAH